jgi:hypothetical protein
VNIRSAVTQAAVQSGVDLTDPSNAFLVSRRDPQGGWITRTAPDWMAAETVAKGMKVAAYEVYVVSVNEQHCPLKLENGQLVPLPTAVPDAPSANK